MIFFAPFFSCICSCCLCICYYLISSISSIATLGSSDFLNSIMPDRLTYFLCLLTEGSLEKITFGIKESKCWNPDGPSILAGEMCFSGDNSDCKSGHCKCSAPLRGGDSCYCQLGDDDPRGIIPDGELNPSNIDELCRSGSSSCRGMLSKTGETCFCNTR